ncbi:MAG: SGNH/GDSL hydrolase family protein [Paracoccaceae bacterium]
MRITAVLIPLVVALFSCTEPVPNDTVTRILAVGDSLLATNGLSGQSIPDVVEMELREPVIDRSVSGASMLYALPISGSAGLSIPKQYREGEWDWVIMNGGGNDLWLGCGCFACDRKMERLISQDGSNGAIPSMIARARRTGAQVIFVGYLRSPGLGSPIEHCRDEGDELERRVQMLSKSDPGLHFLSMADLVPRGDRSFHGIDMIHPSTKASTAIGQRVARYIRERQKHPNTN